jgi:Sodium:dicarboxylate symporter family
LLTILITVLIASKGGANIPSGSLVILATVLTAIGLPVEAIALVAGVDAFMDMGRRSMCSATRSPQRPHQNCHSVISPKPFCCKPGLNHACPGSLHNLGRRACIK